MRIFVVNQYFPPDEAPTGVMLHEVALALRSHGHEVTVFCSKGGYGLDHSHAALAETPPGGIRVERISSTRFGRVRKAGKPLDYLSFYVAAAWKLATVTPRPERLVALTTPPFLSLLCRVVSRIRGCDHAHWVMDLYPDVLFAHGVLGRDSLAGRALSRLAGWGMGGRRSAMVLTLGPDMHERILALTGPRVPIRWIPFWSPVTDAGTAGREPAPDPPGKLESRPLRLMYSGNMGLGHRFGEWLRAAVRWGDTCEWHFSGNGRRRHEIESFLKNHPDAPVRLGPYVARERLAEHLGSADVHLVSMEPCWEGTMIPSKLAGIFAIGKPVIHVGGRHGSAARWIEESGGGWLVEPGDDAAMDAALREALDPGVRLMKGRLAASFAARFFNRKINPAGVAEALGTSLRNPGIEPAPIAARAGH